MGRRSRRRRQGAENPGPEPTEPHRGNVPGEWDHSSGEEEIFEAGLVRGAAGEESELTEEELQAHAEEVGPDQAQAAVGRPELAASGAASGGAVSSRAAKAPAPGQATTGGFRFVQFLKASWAELQRVQWPDRRQVGQATAVVLGFVVIAGAYLGLADVVAQEVIDFIL